MNIKYLYKFSAITLTLFGLLTLFLTTSIFLNLFGVRESEGNYVMFIVTANFISSLLYIVAAYGFWNEKIWTFKFLISSLIILFSSFIALVFYAKNGGVYETKTIGAMMFRIIFTTVFSAFSYLMILKFKKNETSL
jgi:hypothetical protein